MSDAKVSPEATKVEAAASLQPPDGGYGWVVVAASFVVHFLILGNIYSFGVLFPVYIDVFDASQGLVAWVGSISAGLMTGLGAYTGAWADEFGNARMVSVGGVFVAVGFFLASFSTELWHLYLTQGFIAGIGYSLAFIAGVSVVGQWFTTRRGLAVGIAVAGSGLGQFALSLVTGKLLSTVRWRSTLRILALIDIVGLVGCALAIRRFTPVFKRKASESGLVYFKDINFIYLYAGAVISTLGLFMPYTHVPKYAELHGISSSGAVLILSIMGIASAVGRVGIGHAADVFGKVNMLIVCMVVGGVSTLGWLGCTVFATLMIYGVVYGFFAGGVISLFPTVAAELYGIKRIGTVIGILYTGTAFGNLLAAPIAGFIYDGTHSYQGAIILAGGLNLIAAGCVLMVDTKKKFELPGEEENRAGEAGTELEAMVPVLDVVEAGELVEIITPKQSEPGAELPA